MGVGVVRRDCVVPVVPNQHALLVKVRVAGSFLMLFVPVDNNLSTKRHYEREKDRVDKGQYAEQ